MATACRVKDNGAVGRNVCGLTSGSTARAAGSFGEIWEESMIEIKQLRFSFPHSPPGGQPGR
jgi:hypothetical protein